MHYETLLLITLSPVVPTVSNNKENRHVHIVYVITLPNIVSDALLRVIHQALLPCLCMYVIIPITLFRDENLPTAWS